MGVKHVLYFCGNQYLSAFRSPRVIAGYLLALALSIQAAIPYLGYSGSNSVQCNEVFILLFDTRFSISFFLLGLFLIFADAPFVNNQSLLAIYRSNRSCWLSGMLLYIFFQTFCYYFFILIISSCLTMAKAFLTNAWSSPFYNLVFYRPAIAVEKWGMWYPSKYLLQTFTPWSAAVHSFLLIFMYSLILVFILFIINMNYRWIVGSITAFIIHFIGYVIAGNSMFASTRFSLFANAILEWHDGLVDHLMTLSYSYFLYSAIIILLIIIAFKLIKRNDFKSSISGKIL